MAKNYQILLCETYHDKDKKAFIDISSCELGSNSSLFRGQAYDIEFVTKIDGTHSLSFSLPRYYFDEEKGEQVLNELVDFISNKTKIRLNKDDKIFYLVVNNMDIIENNGVFSYKYSCSDSYIEELSKSGYGITFTDKDGLGTIHELAERIVKDYDWGYNAEKTGTLYEYTTDQAYNQEQQRYDTIYNPVPVHPVKYIPEIDQYAYKMALTKPVSFEIGQSGQYLYIIRDTEKVMMTIGDKTYTKIKIQPYRFAKNLAKDEEMVLWTFTKTISNTEEQDFARVYYKNKALYFVDKDNNTHKILDDTSTDTPMCIVYDLKRTYKIKSYTFKNTPHFSFLQQRIYAYDTSQVNSTGTVDNLIYNYNDFVDTIGWTEIDDGLVITSYYTTEEGEVVDKNTYHMLLTKNLSNTTYQFLNDTAADSNKSIKANQPYIFKYKLENGKANGVINKILIYDKNPILNKNAPTGSQISPIYTYAPADGLSQDYYHTLKLKRTILQPYIVFEVQFTNGNEIGITEFQLFEAVGKEIKDGAIITSTAEESNLYLISHLVNGTLFREFNENGEIDENYKDIVDRILLPNSGEQLKAYTHKYIQYFTRDNYYEDNQGNEQKQGLSEDTLSYLNFEEINKPTIRYELEGQMVDGVAITWPIQESNIIEVPDITNQSAQDFNHVYLSKKDGKYYQFYEITAKGIDGIERTNGKWDYALFGDGAHDKRRTLVAEKSNRFNLIQELSELFKVWPVFNIYEENGILKKEFYFREACIKENFAGFHSGINLTSISRKTDSDDIVTKMFVEDQESDLSSDGFISIRKAPMNPWGENYLYNFQHYVNQRLLTDQILITDAQGDELSELMIDHDLKTLYETIYPMNQTIFDLNDQLAEVKVQKANKDSYIKGLTIQLAGIYERKASLEADNQSDSISQPDIDKNNETIARYIDEAKKLEDPENPMGLPKAKADLENLVSQLTDLNEQINTLMYGNGSTKGKTQLIQEFEKKYSQYIKEGIWSDNSYVEPDAYYLDAQKVLNTSSMPKATWSISVVDGSVVPEFEDFIFEVGDKTFLVDNDFFGISKDDEKYVFDVLISQIAEGLDNPTKNKIEVRNYLTSFEDLFQRISAATQTLELNEQTYNKGAYFTANGEVDQNIFQKTLLQNSFTLSTADDNSWNLDHTGLSLQSVINPAKKMRIVADGLFLSNSMNKLTGEPQWKTGITADGINASILTAGTINTARIKIYADGQLNFLWNELGISAYDYDNDYNKDENGEYTSNHFVRFDKYGLYQVNDVKNNFGFTTDTKNPWFQGLDTNMAIKRIVGNSNFSLTRWGFNWKALSPDGKAGIQLGYLTNDYGYIDNQNLYGLWITDINNDTVVALQNNGENRIAGFYFHPSYMYAKNQVKTGLLTTEEFITGVQSGGRAAFAAGVKNMDSWANKETTSFYVTHDGFLYAKNAEIEGKITATEGIISGWIIGDTLYKRYTHTYKGEKLTFETFIGGSSANDTAKYVIGVGYIIPLPNYELLVPTFGVSKTGKLYAMDAEIVGDIQARSLKNSAGDTIIDSNGNLNLVNAKLEGEISGLKIIGGQFVSNDFRSVNESNYLVALGGPTGYFKVSPKGIATFGDGSSEISFDTWWTKGTTDSYPMVMFKDGDASGRIAGIYANYNKSSSRYEFSLLSGNSSSGYSNKIYEIDSLGNIYSDISRVSHYYKNYTCPRDSWIKLRGASGDIVQIWHCNGLIYKVEEL